jgi:hypothetical protein
MAMPKIFSLARRWRATAGFLLALVPLELLGLLHLGFLTLPVLVACGVILGRLDTTPDREGRHS